MVAVNCKVLEARKALEKGVIEWHAHAAGCLTSSSSAPKVTPTAL